MTTELRSLNKIPDNELKKVFMGAIQNPEVSIELLKIMAQIIPIDRSAESNIRGAAIEQLKRRGVTDTNELQAKFSRDHLRDQTIKAIFMTAVLSNNPDKAVLNTASTYNDSIIRTEVVLQPKTSDDILKVMEHDPVDRISGHAAIRLALKRSEFVLRGFRSIP